MNKKKKKKDEKWKIRFYFAETVWFSPNENIKNIYIKNSYKFSFSLPFLHFLIMVIQLPVY